MSTSRFAQVQGALDEHEQMARSADGQTPAKVRGWLLLEWIACVVACWLGVRGMWNGCEYGMIRVPKRE